MWEKDVKINEIQEIRMKTNVFFGVGAIKKIEDIAQDLKKKGIDKVIVISGKGAYKVTGAWDYVEKALNNNGIGYINYAKVTPNPTTAAIDEAVAMAKEFGAKAVIAIGGGSPIDTGKSVAILLEYPEKTAAELYEWKFTAEKAAPIVAINLTHGTGTEVNRFAVATLLEKNFKPAIAYDCIYPSYSIDDPQLMTKLSKNQTLYTSIDAVNHVIEGATSKVASPYSITLAKETIRLVAKYLPKAAEDLENPEWRYYLLYASMLGGVGFDNGMLHYTHALEHPLSAIKPELSHGLGLAMLLPAVIKAIYPDKAATLADILEPIAPGLKGTPDEADKAAKMVEKWLADVGVPQKLADDGFTEADIDKLVDLCFTTPSLDLLLSLAPNEATKERVKQIYEESMKPCK
ncbi:MAG: iron-containing alcohol dehydrogenase [Clostridium sp.]|nr:iron-containing alcohol dehydrogenase [Clostridium sp.]